jgi:hypothetical protein
MCTLDSDLIMREIWERLNQWMNMFLLFILFWFNLVCCDLKSGPGFACLKFQHQSLATSGRLLSSSSSLHFGWLYCRR